MEKETTPLMIGFRRPPQPGESDFTYDEQAQLNISLNNGQRIPAVFLPNALSNIKTAFRKDDGGGGED